MTANAANRRRHHRFDLNFPVKVRLRQEPDKLMETSTRDISAGGIYFSMTEPCEPGSGLELVVTLTSERDGCPVRVHVVGKVIRVEPPDARRRIGVAAVIEKYEFVTGDETGVPVPPPHGRRKRHRARHSALQ